MRTTYQWSEKWRQTKERKKILTQENGKLNTKKLDKLDGERRGTMDHIKGEEREPGMQEQD